MSWRRRHLHSIISSMVLLRTTASLIDRRVSGQSHNSPRSLSLDNRKATLDNGQSSICKMFRKNFSLAAVSFALLRAYLTNLASGSRLLDVQLNLTIMPASLIAHSPSVEPTVRGWAVFTTLAPTTRVPKPMVVCWRNSRLRTIPLMRVSRCPMNTDISAPVAGQTRHRVERVTASLSFLA